MKKDSKNSEMIKSTSAKKSRFTQRSIVLLSCIGLILLAVASTIFMHFMKKADTKDETIYYYPARFDEDIFKNQAYMGLERNLLYSEAGVTRMFDPDLDYDKASTECKFFLDYFQMVIHGEYEKINDFYTDGFFEEEPKFTMQMIYEPYVMFHSVTEEEIDDETAKVYNFEVRYKIFKNNGTFRTGVPSGTAIPQIYQLIKEHEHYRILRVLDIEYEDEA